MSIIIEIPVDAFPRQTATDFTAVWNQAPALNKYSFAPTVATPANNVNIEIMKLSKASVYLISGISFSCDILEGDFQKSIDVFTNLKLAKKITKAQIFTNTIPFINYQDAQEFVYFFNTVQKPDALIGSLTGLLNQIPATVGDLVIRGFVQLNIYEIKNLSWIKKYFNPKTNLGRTLALRGSARVPRDQVKFR